MRTAHRTLRKRESCLPQKSSGISRQAMTGFDAEGNSIPLRERPAVFSMHGMSSCLSLGYSVVIYEVHTRTAQLNHKILHKLFHNVWGNFIVLCWAISIAVFDYVARGLGLWLVALMLGSERCSSD